MDNICVLLVDDEEELVSTLCERLEIRGMTARFATNGQKALAMLESDSYDVVVVDLKMPGLSGEELLDSIKMLHPNLPVIMMTGHGSGTEQEYENPKGAFGFLPKPIGINELVEKMQEAVRSRQQK